MPPPAPPHLLLSAGPGSKGIQALLAAFERRVASRSSGTIMLTERGLPWAQTEALRRLSEQHGVDVAVCSRSAREAGWRLAEGSAPDYVRWSSLATWLADMPREADLWTALP